MPRNSITSHPFATLWHCTVTLMVGLFCFAAGRTSGIRDCQDDVMLREQVLRDSRQYEMRDGIMYRKQ